MVLAGITIFALIFRVGMGLRMIIFRKLIDILQNEPQMEVLEVGSENLWVRLELNLEIEVRLGL